MSTSPFDDPDPSREALVRQIMSYIVTLPPAQQREAIATFVAEALGLMPLETIASLRADIAEAFSEEVPLVRETLELIDGHVAIRQMVAEGSL